MLLKRHGRRGGKPTKNGILELASRSAVDRATEPYDYLSTNAPLVGEAACTEGGVAAACHTGCAKEKVPPIPSGGRSKGIDRGIGATNRTPQPLLVVTIQSQKTRRAKKIYHPEELTAAPKTAAWRSSSAQRSTHAHRKNYASPYLSKSSARRRNYLPTPSVSKGARIIQSDAAPHWGTNPLHRSSSISSIDYFVNVVPHSDNNARKPSSSKESTITNCARPAHVSVSNSLSFLYQSPAQRKLVLRGRYRVHRMIARGSCGKVQLAYDMAEDRLVAIKHVRRAGMSKKRIGGPTEQQKRYSAFLCEVAIMKTLRHEHIVSLYEVIDDPGASELYLVMQYIDNGPIAHIQVEAGTERVCAPIPPDELAGYTMQMLSGLKYLHQLGVVHRDIKPANILVSKDKKVYLVDFGVAETFDTSNRERRERLMENNVDEITTSDEVGGPQVLGTKGTLLFIAPELWRRERSFGKPVDMWAMGVTLYTLLTGRLPFRNLEEITNPTLPVIPTEYGEGWSQLLRGLLHRDGAQRLTVQQAIAISSTII